MAKSELVALIKSLKECVEGRKTAELKDLLLKIDDILVEAADEEVLLSIAQEKIITAAVLLFVKERPPQEILEFTQSIMAHAGGHTTWILRTLTHRCSTMLVRFALKARNTEVRDYFVKRLTVAEQYKLYLSLLYSSKAEKSLRDLCIEELNRLLRDNGASSLFRLFASSANEISDELVKTICFLLSGAGLRNAVDFLLNSVGSEDEEHLKYSLLAERCLAYCLHSEAYLSQTRSLIEEFFLVTEVTCEMLKQRMQCCALLEKYEELQDITASFSCRVFSICEYLYLSGQDLQPEVRGFNDNHRDHSTIFLFLKKRLNTKLSTNDDASFYIINETLKEKEWKITDCVKFLQSLQLTNDTLIKLFAGSVEQYLKNKELAWLYYTKQLYKVLKLQDDRDLVVACSEMLNDQDLFSLGLSMAESLVQVLSKRNASELQNFIEEPLKPANSFLSDEDRHRLKTIAYVSLNSKMMDLSLSNANEGEINVLKEVMRDISNHKQEPEVLAHAVFQLRQLIMANKMMPGDIKTITDMLIFLLENQHDLVLLNAQLTLAELFKKYPDVVMNGVMKNSNSALREMIMEKVGS